MLVWPRALMAPETEGWRRRGVTVSPGMGASGISRRSRTDGGGLWVCEMTAIELWTPQQLHLAAAMELQLEVGITPIIVPRFAHHLAPLPEGATLNPTSPHSDGTPFSDGSLYVGQGIEATTAASAALRATTLQITLTAIAALLGGEPFSIVHPTKGKRLYGIASIQAIEDGVATVTIKPPLREATPAGTNLDFDDPGCVMTLANEDWLSPLDASHEQTAAPVFVEYFGA